MMQSLPRDLQLEIIRRFDMDTRIKCGIIGRLRLPTAFLESKLAKLKPPTITRRQVPNTPLYTYSAKVSLPHYTLSYQGLNSATMSYNLWGVLHDGKPIYCSNRGL